MNKVVMLHLWSCHRLEESFPIENLHAVGPYGLIWHSSDDLSLEKIFSGLRSLSLFEESIELYTNSKNS